MSSQPYHTPQLNPAFQSLFISSDDDQQSTQGDQASQSWTPGDRTPIVHAPTALTPAAAVPQPRYPRQDSASQPYVVPTGNHPLAAQVQFGDWTTFTGTPPTHSPTTRTPTMAVPQWQHQMGGQMNGYCPQNMPTSQGLPQIPVNFPLNFYQPFPGKPSLPNADEAADGSTGNPLPQFAASEETMAQYGMLEFQAAVAREQAHHRGMEQDVFGLWHYSDRGEVLPLEEIVRLNQIQAEQNRRNQPPPPPSIQGFGPVGQGRPASVRTQAARDGATHRSFGNFVNFRHPLVPKDPTLLLDFLTSRRSCTNGHITSGNRTPVRSMRKICEEQEGHKSLSTPIVSESCPELGEVAKALSEYQKSSPSSGSPSKQSDSSDEMHFRPSRMVMEKEGIKINYPHLKDLKYVGDISSKSFRVQVQNLPDKENCSLWITRLHKEANVKALLRTVRTGAVFAVHINPPDEKHEWSAAKLVFMNSSAAAAFVEQSNTRGGISVLKSRIRVVYNRHGYRDYDHPERSRVLQIKGPKGTMDGNFWLAYFGKCVEFQLEGTSKLEDNQDILEFRFARVDGQAESLHQAITREPKFKGVYEVGYARDPCEPKPMYRY
jgi:hypothetical protein